jgi:hypothetical protein
MFRDSTSIAASFTQFKQRFDFFPVPPDLVHLLGESSSVYGGKKSCFDGNINTFLHGEYTILDAKKVMFDGKKKHFAWIQTACKLVKTKTIQQKNALN